MDENPTKVGVGAESVRERHVRLARQVLPLAAVILAAAAILGSGLDRVTFGVVAVSLALMAGLVVARGRRAEGPIRWITALFGAFVLTAGLAVLAGGIWLLTLGSYALLMGLVAVPLSLAPLAWGAMLVQVALAGPTAEPIDLDTARRSDAVRRFDALHRPGRGAGRPAPTVGTTPGEDETPTKPGAPPR